jgi:hypothetical protein
MQLPVAFRYLLSLFREKNIKVNIETIQMHFFSSKQKVNNVTPINCFFYSQRKFRLEIKRYCFQHKSKTQQQE